MTKAKRKNLPDAAPGTIAPTVERWRRGDVERVREALPDQAGRPARPYRATDTLTQMVRKGTISPAMGQAAEDFRAVFEIARLDPLAAADVSRLPGGFSDQPMTVRQVEARKRVWQALTALGGIASPAGSCVWHVVGCEATLKDWALRSGWSGRPLSPEAASGILVGALGVLQGFYGL